MSEAEKINGTRQMIVDLETLAKQDGCIAAAWALEWIEIASKNCDPQRVFRLREALALHRNMVLGGERESTASETCFHLAMESSGKGF
jgi:hypothetical protein